MPFEITTPVQCFLFPDDEAKGKQTFLDLVRSPEETWLIAYALTMPNLVDEMVAAARAGVVIHAYVDRTQSAGAAEKPLLQQLIEAGVETTIGTSTAGTKYICHSKGMTTASGRNWEGSVNFSNSGWLQVNTGMRFDSVDWGVHFRRQFDTLVGFAWDVEKDSQIMSSPPRALVLAQQRHPGG